MRDRDLFSTFDKITLIDILEDQATNWLAHNVLWLQVAERPFGMETALDLDREAWIAFTQIEGKRVMCSHSLKRDGGLDALKQALPQDTRGRPLS